MSVFTIQHSIKIQSGESNARAKLFLYYNKKACMDLGVKAPFNPDLNTIHWNHCTEFLWLSVLYELL